MPGGPTMQASEVRKNSPACGPGFSKSVMVGCLQGRQRKGRLLWLTRGKFSKPYKAAKTALQRVVVRGSPFRSGPIWFIV